MKAEMVEGQEARKNFEKAMRQVFRVSKTEILEAEHKDKKKRKRKKV